MSRPVLSVEQGICPDVLSVEQGICPDRPPHCDARVLHLPAECVYCAKASNLQEERERLGVSNTGHANRAWPCPADRARSSQSLNAWSGNRPKTAEDLKREDEAWRKFIATMDPRIDGDDPGDC